MGAMALCISSASAALVFDYQIDSTFVASTPAPDMSAGAMILTGGLWSPFDDSTSPWLNIVPPSGFATFDTTGPFSFVWGSPSTSNLVVTTGDGQVYDTSDLIAAAAGKGVTIVNKPFTFGYLVTITGSYTAVTLSQQAGGGNFEVGFGSPAVPEPSTWALIGLGFAGLAFAGYRSGRTAISIA